MAATTKTDRRRSTRREREAAARRAQHRRQWTVRAVVLAAVAIFVAVAAAAFASSGGEGAASSSYSDDPETFVLPALGGDGDVSLASHAGTPSVVNFFASWCVYCNEELPGFVQVAKATRGDVDFIGVNTSETGDGRAMAERFALAGAGFDLARDIGPAPASRLWERLGGRGLPVTAFYDANGKLVDFAGGMLAQDDLEQRVRSLFGVQVQAADASEPAAPVIPLIPQGAAELINTHAGDPGFVVLDARTPQEFAEGHIAGAINVDVQSPDFDARIAELDHDRSYAVYCRSGSRSKIATDAMHEAGFKRLYDVQGGIQAWLSLDLPVTTE